MGPLERAERAARMLAWLSASSLAGAMLVTVVDIALRLVSRLASLVLDAPVAFAVAGAVDLVQLAIMAAAFLAIPYAFVGDGHVTVDLLVLHLTARMRRLLEGLAALLGFGLCAALLWFGLEQARLQMMFGDRSATLQIPMIWYWVPLLAGMALSALAMALVAAVRLGQAFASR